MAKPDAAGNPNSIDYKWQIRAKTHMVTSGDLLARIADLEAAGRLLGAECRAWRKWWDLTPTEPGWTPKTLVDARRSTDAHPTAAKYVKTKETTDGH